MNKLIFMSTLFTSARMGIGATTIPYLLSKGVTLSEIALIKLIQALVIFFGEIPTGVIADYFGRKISILLSCVCAMISFLIFYYSHDFTSYALAEIFNALTICFFSGAFESLLIDSNSNIKNDKEKLGEVFSKIGIYGSIATMVTGCVGGYIGGLNLGLPFLFSFFLMGATLLVTLTVDEEKSDASCKDVTSFVTFFKQQLLMIIRQKNLYLYFVFFALIQFAYQPVFHYWQPYFINVRPEINSEMFGNIFFLYVFIHFVFSFLTKKVLNKKIIELDTLKNIYGGLMVFSFIGMSFTEYFYSALVLFLVMQGCGNSYRTLMSASLNSKIESKDRASVLSSISFISRIGMFLSLIFVGQFLKIIPISYLYLISAVAISFIFFLPFMLRLKKVYKYKNRGQLVHD